MKAAPGEQYTIRQKILTFFGASFHIFDAEGQVIGFCRQKALKLREDIRVYTAEDQAEELFGMKARSILDFSTTYDITLPDGTEAGSLRRRGFKSMLRDEWQIFDTTGKQIARVSEDSAWKAILRRILGGLSAFMPQRFTVQETDAQGSPSEDPVATFRTHFNPFVYRLGIGIHRTTEELDEMVLLASACLIGAIEGRQSNGGGGSGLFSGD